MSVTDPDGNTTSYTYNAAHEVATADQPDRRRHDVYV